MMCEYCNEKANEVKDLINNGFPDPKTAIVICIGYSEVDGKPSIVSCSPRGIDFININYCPMCGNKLSPMRVGVWDVNYNNNNREFHIWNGGYEFHQFQKVFKWNWFDAWKQKAEGRIIELRSDLWD